MKTSEELALDKAKENGDIFLWVDDCRPMPPLYNTLAKTYEEAIQHLKTGKVILISLDHDLGQEKTGYDIAKYIEEGAANATIPRMHVRIHTDNPVGRQNIKMALQKAHEYWRQK